LSFAKTGKTGFKTARCRNCRIILQMIQVLLKAEYPPVERAVSLEKHRLALRSNLRRSTDASYPYNERLSALAGKVAAGSATDEEKARFRKLAAAV